MKTWLSLSPRSGLSRRARVIVIACAALLPLSLFAQQAVQQGGAAKSLLPGGAATALPFTGEGWQDKVLLHEGYVMPPPELAAAVLAPREMNVTLGTPSPDRKWFLDEIGDGPTPMSIFGKPYDELGGVFIDYKANRQRALTRRNTIGLQIISATDGTRKTIATPPNTRVTNPRWTEDGLGVMYMTLGEDSTHVWVTDLATNKPRQITKTSMLATFVTNFTLINGGKQLVAVFPPDGRTARPAPPVVPSGPEILVSMDTDRNRLRTFPSLMRTPYEFQLLEWHATGQIGIVDIATGAMTKFGTPGMITSLDMSPEGKYARVTRMTKPFSYVVPQSSFGSIEEIWDATGKALAKVSERPLNLGVQATPTPVPVDPTNPNAQPAPQVPGAGGGRGGGAAADNGRREMAWRADGQGFNYLQLEPLPTPPPDAGRGRTGGGAAAADPAQGAGGQAAVAPTGQATGRAGGRGAGQTAAPEPPRKDRLTQWLPPFTESSIKVIYENPTRMTGYRFSPDGQILFFTENGNQTAMYLSDMTTKYVIARGGGGGGAAGGRGAGGGGGQGAGRGGGGGNDAVGTLMAAPGRVASTSIGSGTPVMLSPDGASVYFQGSAGGGRGANAAPAKPFIDKVVIKTGERSRLLEVDPAGMTTSVTSVIDPELKKLVISKQNATTPPQQFLWDNGNLKQLTNNEDLFPDLTRMVVQRFTVTRPDGFTFRTVVSLPADYKEGTRLPGFFWFYPAEFTSQEQYDGGRGGGGGAANTPPTTFPNFGTLSKQFLVRLGYAVIENDAPIVGPAGQMNNNYVADLRNDLAATIDELDKRMLIDRTRLAIGGHSYGAFSTVNALVNTPFFRAGIAGDGAYNRTLTPMGFQNEQRDLWDAPNVYLDMSPFLRANQMTGALLMYHGLADQNVGTDPINSVRLFNALNGLGKVAALYYYPFEDHGPAGRETLLDLWSRWAAWLDKYVKNPQPIVKPTPTPTPSGRGGGH